MIPRTPDEWRCELPHPHDAHTYWSDETGDDDRLVWCPGVAR